jgi:predicted TPR repeat methyltransferase
MKRAREEPATDAAAPVADHVAAWKREGDEAIKQGDAETAFGCYTAALTGYAGPQKPSGARLRFVAQLRNATPARDSRVY